MKDRRPGPELSEGKYVFVVYDSHHLLALNILSIMEEEELNWTWGHIQMALLERNISMSWNLGRLSLAV